MSSVLPEPADPCLHGVARVPVAEARQRILKAVEPVRGIESLSLRGTLGRILARDMYAPFDVPGHTNSAVDGYALAGAGLPTQGESEFPIVGTAWAGQPFDGAVAAGGCVRIMTGAPLPSGTDTVVMQEHVRAESKTVHIGGGHRIGQNVRVAGEDLARGSLALGAGKRLIPADLGLLASLGIAEVPVFRRVRAAFLSTGDELRSIGEPLVTGAVYDSNRYTLHGMLQQLGVEILDLGVVRDDRKSVYAAFREAASVADVVITSGGVSVGDADYVKETLEALGKVGFWQIAMKPGRPLAFGHLDRAAFFGLPGNPVAVMVTFYQFVQPALQRMMGEDPVSEPLMFRAKSLSRFRKQPGRTEFQRAIVETDANGAIVVRKTGTQGSGILRSMSLANCFVVLPHDAGDIEPGTQVMIQPFFGLLR